MSPDRSGDGRAIAAARLEEFISAVFVRCGLPAESASLAAEALIHADRLGLTTHGIRNLESIYVAKLVDGAIDPKAEAEVVHEHGAVAVVDGHRAIGLVVGARAMDLAIAKAETFGVGAVAVRGSTHFGAAGYYATRARLRGMVGLAVSNLGAQAVAPVPGGAVKMVGTNPLGFAAPAGRRPPLLLDMSTTVSSTGKVRAARRAGEPLPEGILVGPAGEWVTDPAALDQGGAHLTMLGGRPETGAWKGLGLALMVDVLAGLLSGAAVGPDPRVWTGNQTDDNDVGHFFLALRVASFRRSDDFASAMDRMLGALLDCPTGAGRPASYPGYPEAERAQRSDAIALDEDQVLSMGRLARHWAVSLPWATTAAEQHEARMEP